jgi:polyhydroxyalkanoate synthase subunit PhaC
MATLKLPYGPDVPIGIPSAEALAAAAGNVYEWLTNGHLADLTPLPSEVLHTTPQTTVSRYTPSSKRAISGPAVLLVPPLAAPATCFDLRRGCSVAEHFVGRNHPTYLVDYGTISFSDRRLGLEHWVDKVIPDAVDVASRDAGQPVHIVAWCLGGIMALLTQATRHDLPIASITAIGSPFDISQVPLIAPFRPIAIRTGGWIGTLAYRALGGVPAPLVKRAFQLSSVDKYVTKPLAILTHLDDRDFLAQIEAVDAFTSNMAAYPGRTFGQLYHRFMRTNDLADGTIDLGNGVVSLADVTVAVLIIAGDDDVIAPKRAVHHLGDLLPGAAEVRLETAPGGHLGVLAGRKARGTTWRSIDRFLADRHATAA